MKSFKLIKSIFALSMLLLLACGDDDKGGNTDPCNSNFDQEAMFTNIADNIIIEGYKDLLEDVNALSSATTDFINDVNTSNIENLRTAYLQAYLSFQKIGQFEFGPAETVFLRNSLGNFPTNTEEIENNISSGTYDFSQPDVFDKGFPALDYMLYDIVDDTPEGLDIYINNAEYRDYLNALVTDIVTRSSQTMEAWETDYRGDFIQNTGTAAGTSLSLIINALNQNYELIKRQKLGVPSGVLTLGFINPEEVEGFYGGHGAQLATTALKATENLYLGGTSIGLDDYLIAVNAEKNGELLDDLIKAQFTAAITAVEALADPLSLTIENEQPTVESAYNEVAKQLVNIKTDLPSVLCVSITYIDNPSDSD